MARQLMGGNYQAQLTIDGDDVLAMFMDVFGDMPVRDLMVLLAQRYSAKAISAHDEEAEV